MKVPAEWVTGAQAAAAHCPAGGAAQAQRALSMKWTTLEPLESIEEREEGWASIVLEAEAFVPGRAPPTFMKHKDGKRFSPELSFAMQPTHPLEALHMMERIMYWTLQGRAPPVRWSARTFLRKLKGDSKAGGPLKTAGNLPGREGWRPEAGETISEWVQANGEDASGEEPHLPAEGSKIWGQAPNTTLLTEEDVRALHSHGTWKPHVMSSWLDWWATAHPDVSAGAWVASVGTLHTAFSGGTSKISIDKVRRHGPTHLTQARATHFWFPLHDIRWGWGMIWADIEARQLTTWGRVPQHLRDRASQWMNAWMKDGHTDSDTGPWPVTSNAAPWKDRDDVATAMQMAEWIRGGEVTEWEEEQKEWAARLLPQICRDYGAEQDRRQEGSEVPPPSEPAVPKLNKHEEARKRRAMHTTVESTRSHMMWQQVRAEAARQKKRRQPLTEEAQGAIDWKRQWRVAGEDRSDPTCHVVTVNVGPRGLQVCIEDLPHLIGQHNVRQMVIHLQDIRITG